MAGTNKMRRAVITAPHTIEFQTVEIRPPGPSEILVRVRSCAVCTWEQRTYTGVDPRAYPLLGGHEIGGVVEEVGREVLNDVRPGDHVAVAGLLRCGQCYSCRRGYDNLCDNLRSLRSGEGEPWGPGGFGDYLVAKDYQVYKVDETLSFQEAALCEPLACVLRSIKRGSIQPADHVVVIGAGIMGVLHLVLASGRGATTIVAEIDGARGTKAKALGADHLINPKKEDYIQRIMEITDGHGAEKTFITAGVADAIEDALQAAAKNGQVQIYAAVHPQDTTIRVNPNLFHDKEIRLTGTLSQSREDFYQAAELLSRRLIDVGPFITARYPLEQLEEAVIASLDKETYRVLVDTQ